MKVLIVSLFNSWETHFAVELEIAERHLAAGDEVEFLGCDACIENCTANPWGKISKCDRCRLRRREGLKLLSKPVCEHRLGDYLPADTKELEAGILDSVRDVRSAESYRFNGHDLGMGALSSTIWRARDPLVQSDRSRRLLANYTTGAVRAYRATQSFLAANRGYDRAYVFNGRLGCTRGVFLACREIAGMETFTHERGSSIERFTTFRNAMPHDRELWTRETLRTWHESSNTKERDRIARLFYEERRGGIAVDWKSFTKDQDAGLLPKGFDPKKTNVVIYNSSEDEFVGMGEEWKNPVYAMQSHGVERIITEALARYPNLHFYLRMHPNLAGVANQDVQNLRDLAARALPNFTLIEPDSKISSYTLLDLAEKIVTFGSTVGVEATFWGKASIMAGHSFYENLGAVYVAANHEALMTLVGQTLPPRPQETALQYAYYARTHGEKFRYWQARTFYEGEFRGQSLQREPWGKLNRRLRLFAEDAIRAWQRR